MDFQKQKRAGLLPSYDVFTEHAFLLERACRYSVDLWQSKREKRERVFHSVLLIDVGLNSNLVDSTHFLLFIRVLRYSSVRLRPEKVCYIQAKRRLKVILFGQELIDVNLEDNPQLRQFTNSEGGITIFIQQRVCINYC